METRKPHGGCNQRSVASHGMVESARCVPGSESAMLFGHQESQNGWELQSLPCSVLTDRNLTGIFGDLYLNQTVSF